MSGDRGDAIGSACDRGDAVVRESNVIPGDLLADAMDTASPAAAVTAETPQEYDISNAASPSRRILRETSSLGAMLARVMDEPSSTESVTSQTRQVQEVSVLSSHRRRILRKTSSSCVPVAVGTVPPGLIPEGEVWHRFTPSVIDPALCLARTFNAGAGGQCKRKPRAGEVTCAMCKTPVHGRVDGPIPDNKLATFLRAATKRN